jgi:S-adenosyl-L-methionine hydrolase (adenosine-forming)
VQRPFISITSDYGVQTQGIGIMHGVALSIAPSANVVDLMHGLPEFNIIAAARTMESVQFLPVGFHVCICDPGVGSRRRALACLVNRGDVLIGPDNGVLLPATRFLGGLAEIHEVTNREYMTPWASATFHGRDVFVPAAAHLARGVPIGELGPRVEPGDLHPGPYEDAIVSGRVIHAKVIQVNHFGSIHLNMTQSQWEQLGFAPGKLVHLDIPGLPRLSLPVASTFSDVGQGECLILQDDYGRVEVAKNLGSFVAEYPVSIGTEVRLEH